MCRPGGAAVVCLSRPLLRSLQSWVYVSNVNDVKAGQGIQESRSVRREKNLPMERIELIEEV
jgi:hypothetical protein